MLALSVYEGMLCGCGCGQWSEIAHDADTDGWWEVNEATVCQAGATLERWRTETAGNAEPGQLIHVELSRDYQPKGGARVPLP
jgi:hypothetical protein